MDFSSQIVPQFTFEFKNMNFLQELTFKLHSTEFYILHDNVRSKISIIMHKRILIQSNKLKILSKKVLMKNSQIKQYHVYSNRTGIVMKRSQIFLRDYLQ